jgi:hypothetical protein
MNKPLNRTQCRPASAPRCDGFSRPELIAAGLIVPSNALTPYDGPPATLKLVGAPLYNNEPVGGRVNASFADLPWLSPAAGTAIDRSGDDYDRR